MEVDVVTAQAERTRYADDPAQWRREYRRDYAKGIRRTNGKTPALLRLLAKLDRDPGELVVPELGPCWVWLGATNADGYGIVRDDQGRLALVHRLALAAALDRPIRDGFMACHKCDNRRCARPAHLYEGSPEDNVGDMIVRGRYRGFGYVPELELPCGHTVPYRGCSDCEAA